MKALAAALCLAAWPALAVPPDQEMDTPTTREGYKARNDRQRAHEEMFAPFYARDRKWSLNGGRDYLECPVLDPAVLADQMRAMSCNSDAVAVVTVYNQRPVFSRGENFIFTEYKVETNEVIKAGPGSLAPGSRTTIARIGGEIVLPTEHLGMKINIEPPFLVGGQYLVLLRYLPATNDYVLQSHDSAYEIRPGGLLRPFQVGQDPLSREQSSEVWASARRGCQ